LKSLGINTKQTYVSLSICHSKSGVHGVWRHFQQYFSYIVAASFIGGGNRSTRRKPPTWSKSVINFIT